MGCGGGGRWSSPLAVPDAADRVVTALGYTPRYPRTEDLNPAHPQGRGSHMKPDVISGSRLGCLGGSGVTSAPTPVGADARDLTIFLASASWRQICRRCNSASDDPKADRPNRVRHSLQHGRGPRGPRSANKRHPDQFDHRPGQCGILSNFGIELRSLIHACCDRTNACRRGTKSFRWRSDPTRTL
jgi:hypothetical protein